MHYIVLGGGTSPEKAVSLRSATAVQHALVSLGHTVTFIDPESVSMQTLLEQAKTSDGIFPILHGAGGEDGTLQKAFEREGIPYFGPSSASCKTTFNKDDFKHLLTAHAIPTPRWNIVAAGGLAAEPLTQGPFVLKPISGGSSIDTFIIRTLPFNAAPLEEALSRYGSMLIEEFIEGIEITVGILDTTPLPVIEIIPPQGQEFDYENKYNGATAELCPPHHVSHELQEKAQELARTAHEITNCRHLSRTDMLINNRGELFIIDTNTIPGLTDQSLYPKAAATAGLEWNTLVNRFVAMLSESNE